MSSLRRLTQESIGTGGKSLGFARLFAGLLVVAGATALGMGAAAMPTAVGLGNYAALESGSSFATLQTMVFIVLSGGLLLLVAGLFEFFGARADNRSVVIFAVAVTVAGAGALLAGAVVGKGVLSDLEFVLCADSDGDCTPRDSGFTDAQKQIVNTELAIFDECCVGDSGSIAQAFSDAQDVSTAALGVADINLFEERIQTSAYGECGTGDIFADVCPNKVPEIIGDVVSQLVPLLCTCAPDSVAYNQVRQKIRNDAGTCKKFEELQFTIDGSVVVPTTTFSLLSLVVPQYTDFFDRNPGLETSITVPVVGNPGPPWVPADYPAGGLGCGLGITKGLQWYTLLYANEGLSVTFDVAIATGIIGFLAAALTVAFMCVSAKEDLDLLDYEEYPVAVRAAPAVNMTSKTTASSNPQAASAPAPAPAEGTAKVSKSQRDALERRLNAFYAIHEPAKLTNGRIHADVVNFGVLKGEAALNAKLKGKYGFDLSDFEAAQSEDSASDNASEGSRATDTNVLGEALVKRDVDDII